MFVCVCGRERTINKQVIYVSLTQPTFLYVHICTHRVNTEINIFLLLFQILHLFDKILFILHAYLLFKQ